MPQYHAALAITAAISGTSREYFISYTLAQEIFSVFVKFLRATLTITFSTLPASSSSLQNKLTQHSTD